MKMSRPATVLLAFVLAVMITGCTQRYDTPAPEAGGDKIKVAFVPKLQGSPYFEAMDAGGKRAATGPGHDRVALSGADDGRRRPAGRRGPLLHPAEGRRDHGRAERSRLDGAADETGPGGRDQGRDVGHRRTELGPRGVRQPGDGRGHRAPRLIDSLMKAMGEEGQVGHRLLRRDGGEPELLDRRREGLRHGEVPEDELADVVFSGEDQAKATQMATDFMSANPNLKGLIGQCTTSAVGVAQAVRDAARSARCSPSASARRSR